MEIIFLLVGLLFLILGVAILWDHIRFSAGSRSCRAKVIALEKRTTPPDEKRKQGGPIYYPVVQYSADGKTREFTSKIGSSMPLYEIGEQLSVLYNRKRDEARIEGKGYYIGGGLVLAIGIGLSVLFFNIFNPSLWSFGFSGFILLAVMNSIRKKLKQHDISSYDELKEAFRNTRMKTREGTDPENTERITDARKLEQSVYEQSKSLKWAGPIMTLIGAGALVLGIYLGYDRAEFLETALPDTGKVVALNEKSSTSDGTTSYTYYPVVEYTPGDNENKITFEHDVGSNPPSYSVGEEVEVLYDPQDPDEAIIDAGIMNWFGAGIATILGLFFFMGGIYSIKRWRKMKNSPYISH
ncbi:MAG: DUF3592 domain-containing protein [Balneolaceae bacterium]|nr:DUF3592 domain-containing protein [Balneolaceae bacterium]